CSSDNKRRRLKDRERLVSPKTLKPSERQLCVAHRVLDRFVSQIALDRARIDALVGQLVARNPRAKRVELVYVASPTNAHASANPFYQKRVFEKETLEHGRYDTDTIRINRDTEMRYGTGRLFKSPVPYPSPSLC